MLPDRACSQASLACTNLYQLHNRMTIFIETIKFNICSNQQNVLILIRKGNSGVCFLRLSRTQLVAIETSFNEIEKNLINRNKSMYVTPSVS